MAKKGRTVKGAKGVMKGGSLGGKMSKATKNAIKHMPKGERAMVLATLKNSTSGMTAWSHKKIMERKGGGGKEDASASAKSSRPAGSQSQNAFALFSKPDQRILIIGDGNFSFAASLVTIFNGKGENITATCYDSKEVLHAKYSDAKVHIKTLLNAGASVHYEIDATRLWAFHGLDAPYDLIVFNFPHVGLGIKDQATNIAANQELVSGFLHSAHKYIHPKGALCVTVKKGEPYDSWRIARLGLAVPGLRLKTAVDFQPSAFPSFVHQRTAGERGVAAEGEKKEEDNGLIGNGAKTFVFSGDAETGDKKDTEKAKAKGKGGPGAKPKASGGVAKRRSGKAERK